MSLFTMASTLVVSGVVGPNNGDGRTQVCPTDLFQAAMFKKGTINAKFWSTFPYKGAGFVISAGPPPQAEIDEWDQSTDRTTYLAYNKKGYGAVDSAAVKKQYDSLKAALGKKTGWTFQEAKGVYENEAEESLIVDPGITGNDPQVHKEAEALRLAYFQDSYLFFGSLDETKTPPSRKIILGFGFTAPYKNSINYADIGRIQKYDAATWGGISTKPKAWTEVTDEQGKVWFYAAEYNPTEKTWFGDVFAPSDQCGEPLKSLVSEKRFWEEYLWNRTHT